ncbi:MAG: 2-phospho-L-lactate transferase CofD family protein, partial [Agrobacterium sp.]|uniref:2-phospho-L-lactate transferase CofD family protein n=1 Tax=Agrobacterium sp. TaxID=361 RepID=UPI004034BED7
MFYLSSEGTGQQHEVLPSAHPTALAEVQKADAVIYGMGSLYTSICPIVCLSG